MGQCVSQQPTFGTAPQSSQELSSSEPAITSSAEGVENHLRDTESLPAGEEKVPDAYEVLTKETSGKRATRKSSIASLVPKVRGTFQRRKSGRHKNLSATFNMAGMDFKVAALDINTATEEELMTLPGINRTLAHKIIDHRSAIGGFKKIEDLALVSGIGAVKLQLIKPEICIDKKLSSRSSSVANTELSFNSVNGDVPVSSSSPRNTDSSKIRKRDVVNINTATIFQLMTVEGINQELAAHIVHHRERKGPFKTVYDLRKVHGFSTRLISALSPYLSTYDYGSPSSLTGHRRTASLPIGPGFTFPVFENGKFSEFPTLTEFSEVLKITENGVRDQTEETEDAVDQSPTNENHCVRILYWNLDGLTGDKARNPGVVEVVANVLKQHSIIFAVIQGVTEASALEELCVGINHKLKDKPSSQFYGFVDGDTGYLSRRRGTVLEIRSISAASGAIAISRCCLNDKELTVASLVRAPGRDVNAAKVVKDVLDNSANERVILMADLSDADHAKTVEEFQDLGYRPLVTKSISTAYDAVKNDPSNSIHCNVLVSRYGQKGLTGNSGVITEGLTHLLIPIGWSWNGPASRKCPVWFEVDTSLLE